MGVLVPVFTVLVPAVLMLTVGGVSYLAGGLWLMVGLLRTATLKVGEETL